MDAESWDVYIVVDLFLLLLIGIGPKIALVPFLEATKGMDEATKALVTRKMLGTAATVAVILVVLGELLDGCCTSPPVRCRSPAGWCW